MQDLLSPICVSTGLHLSFPQVLHQWDALPRVVTKYFFLFFKHKLPFSWEDFLIDSILKMEETEDFIITPQFRVKTLSAIAVKWFARCLPSVNGNTGRTHYSPLTTLLWLFPRLTNYLQIRKGRDAGLIWRLGISTTMLLILYPKIPFLQSVSLLYLRWVLLVFNKHLPNCTFGKEVTSVVCICFLSA